MDIEEAVAREAIRDLVVRYNSNSDSGRFPELFALFAPDAVMELGDGAGGWKRHDGIDEIATIFTGVQGLMEGQTDPAAMRYIRHYTATHQIDLIDADHARGRLYFAVLLPHGLDHWGRYIDQYVRRDGTWRFAHRKVQVDGQTPGSPFGHQG
jgi:hypothetical protein